MIEELESQRLALQARLDAEKTSEERNRMGQFATPSPLARDVLAHARGLLPAKTRVSFLDPALGSGAFYAAFRRVFNSRDIVRAQAYEIDAHYGQHAEQLWTPLGLKLVHGDFTRAHPDPSFNLVICNPPYVRHHHLSVSDKTHLAACTRSATGLRLSGLAGLYCHFLLQTQAWMARDAIAGWLIPSEFMDVNYGRQVKEYLLSQVTLLQIHRFDPDDVQFADALVSSTIVWLKNAPPSDDHDVRFTYGGTLANPLVERMVPRADLELEHKWTRYPRLGKRQADERTKVGDLFRIKRGLATGDNEFFVIDEAEVKARELPSKALRPILPSPRHIEGDVIVADMHGVPTNARRLFLLDPRMDQDEINAEHPSLADYLAEGVGRGLNERYLCRSRKRWYDQERRDPAPIVCTYLGRGDNKSARPFRFIRNHSNATVANSYLAMYPTPELQARLDKQPELLDRLWKQLNAIKPEDLLGEGRVYGGGLYKLEPKELAKVPLDID